MNATPAQRRCPHPAKALTLESPWDGGPAGSFLIAQCSAQLVDDSGNVATCGTIVSLPIISPAVVLPYDGNGATAQHPAAAGSRHPMRCGNDGWNHE